MVFYFCINLPHFAQSLDMLDGGLSGEVDLFLSGEAANAETNGRVREVLVGTDRSQHVGWLQGGRCARAARRERNVLAGHEETLALDVRERDVHAARVAFLGVAVQRTVRQLGHDLIDESL